MGVRIPFQDFEGQFRARLRLPITRRTKYTGGLPGLTRLCASARLKQGAVNRVSRGPGGFRSGNTSPLVLRVMLSLRRHLIVDGTLIA
jgi:hypothetical protein